MSRLTLPASPEELVLRLKQLHNERKTQKGLFSGRRRIPLSPQERSTVLEKTAGRCHLCGGEITEKKFAADHVLAHAVGGAHAVDNYLPAHSLCNGCRWFYSPEEFQWILKIGVWARKQMENSKDRHSRLGKRMAEEFWRHEKRTASRRVNKVDRPDAS